MPEEEPLACRILCALAEDVAQQAEETSRSPSGGATGMSLPRLGKRLGQSASVLVRELTDTYLALVERDPHIYQFVITRPLGHSPVEDPVSGITGRIGNEVAEAFRTWLRTNGLDARAANTWGHGVVGFVWAIADKWITTGHQRPRADIVDFTVRLFDPAFSHQQPTPRSPERSAS